MRISDWSSDVCSSDLANLYAVNHHIQIPAGAGHRHHARAIDDGGRSGAVPDTVQRLVWAAACQPHSVHPVGGGHRPDDFRNQRDPAAGHPWRLRHRRAIRSDVGLRHAGREHAHAAAMAGSGDSTDPFPDHRRRQLSESDDARRYSGEPLAIGVDRVGIAHHGHHFRSRTAAMISTPHRRSRAALVIAGCASLTACVVGPDYRAPPAVDTGGGWTRPVDQASAPAELARWWSTLGDPELERLVDTALAQNLDIRQAAARIDEARALRDLAAGLQLPTVAAGASVNRRRQSENGPLPIGPIPGLEASQTLNVAGFDPSRYAGHRLTSS